MQRRSSAVSPDWCLISAGSDGTKTATGDAGEAGGGGGELWVRTAETLWGVHGAEAEAGVPEHEGHDGQRVRATGKDASLLTFLKCYVWTKLSVFSTLCTLELKRASGVKRSWRKSSDTEWRYDRQTKCRKDTGESDKCFNNFINLGNYTYLCWYVGMLYRCLNLLGVVIQRHFI